MTRIGRILAGVAVIVALLGIPAGVSADSRCSGSAGLQAWQDTGLNGVSFIRCGNVADLTTVNDNIAVGDWNDRISSWQTFNVVSTSLTCLFENTNFGYTLGSRNSRITGSNTVLDVGSTANDRASSLKFGVSTSTCPTS